MGIWIGEMILGWGKDLGWKKSASPELGTNIEGKVEDFEKREKSPCPKIPVFFKIKWLCWGMSMVWQNGEKKRGCSWVNSRNGEKTGVLDEMKRGVDWGICVRGKYLAKRIFIFWIFYWGIYPPIWGTI